MEQSHPKNQDDFRTKIVKSEPIWNDEPCPNIVMNNRTLCAAGGSLVRSKRNSTRVDQRGLTPKTLAINLRGSYKLKAHLTSESKGKGDQA